MQADVQRLSLSADALRELDPQRRYVFALVGHIFNELMLLQKWIHISRRAPGHPGPQEDAAVGVTLFLVRLLSAKVYEALHEDALRKASVNEVLRTDYFGKVEGLSERWDEVLAQHDKLEWLRWIRNRGGFHYMNANQWAPGLEDSMCDDAYIRDLASGGAGKLGGQVGIAGHISIPDKVNFGAQAGTLGTGIKEGETFLGSPALPVKDYMRSAIIYPKLPEMYRAISQLQREIEQLKKEITNK